MLEMQLVENPPNQGSKLAVEMSFLRTSVLAIYGILNGSRRNPQF